jgi:hypothetical protein
VGGVEGESFGGVGGRAVSWWGGGVEGGVVGGGAPAWLRVHRHSQSASENLRIFEMPGS